MLGCLALVLACSVAFAFVPHLWCLACSLPLPLLMFPAFAAAGVSVCVYVYQRPEGDAGSQKVLYCV